MGYRILTASYSNEIVTLNFDPESRKLSTVASLTVGHHPSWITPHISDPSIYFTALEQENGVIIVLRYDSDGIVRVVREISSLGADPCTLVMSRTKGDLLVGNYSSGSVVAVPITSPSPYLGSPQVQLELKGTGPFEDRQLSSHPHQVIEHPNRDELLVPDLGSDKTWRIVKPEQGPWEVRGYIKYSAGSGPRHVAFYGDVVYTLAELTNVVIAHRLPPLPSEPIFLASSPTMANPPPSPNNMYAAEILVPTPNARFPAPYLYVSNRNDPSPEGDTIAIFSIADDKLELINEVHTGLKHVRGIVFGGPDSEWLIAGGVFGNGVKIFERVDGGKGLKEIASDPTVQAPTGFVWI